MTDKSIFLTKVRTPRGRHFARLLIESIQYFGGAMCDVPIWLSAVSPQEETCQDLASTQVRVISLEPPEPIKAYPFGDKVDACAQAEQLIPAGVHALIWLDLECLVDWCHSLLDHSRIW